MLWPAKGVEQIVLKWFCYRMILNLEMSACMWEREVAFLLIGGSVGQVFNSGFLVL